MTATALTARDLHADAVVGDAHNDLLMAVTARPPREWGSFFATRWLPQLRQGGVDIQVLPVFVDTVYQPEGALRQTLRMIECVHRICEESPDDVTLCRDGDDIVAAVDAGRIALVLALESMPGIGDSVELVPLLARLGVRVASLAHWGRTPLADGSGEDATGSRLTRAGVEAVELMDEWGILLDISHLGATGVEHALEVSRRPVIATHSSARALHDHHRNLTDEQLKAVAAAGGLVCVNFHPPFLHDDDHTIDRLLTHLEHVTGIVGIDHVGLGPDFLKEVAEELAPTFRPPTWPSMPGLDGPADLPNLTAAMVDRGWLESDIRQVLGLNMLRLFRDHLGR